MDSLGGTTLGSDGQNTEYGWIHLLAGIGAGVVVGSLIALLAAPQPGAETRDQLRETAEEGLTRLRHSIDDLRSRVEEIADRRERESVLAGSGLAGAADHASPA